MGFDHVANVTKGLYEIWSREQPDLYLHSHPKMVYFICHISIWDQFKLFKMSYTVFYIYSVVLVTYIKLHDQNGDMENNSPHFYIEVTYYS